MPGWRAPAVRASALAVRPLPAAKEAAIRAALAVPGRSGVRVIAGRFKVNPSTVQRISAEMVTAQAAGEILGSRACRFGWTRESAFD